MSTALRSKLNLDVFSHMGRGSFPGLTTALDQSMVSGITVVTLESLARTLLSSGTGDNRGEKIVPSEEVVWRGGREGTNPHFNEVLFGEYRNHQVGGSPSEPVTSASKSPMGSSRSSQCQNTARNPCALHGTSRV